MGLVLKFKYEFESMVNWLTDDKVPSIRSWLIRSVLLLMLLLLLFRLLLLRLILLRLLLIVALLLVVVVVLFLVVGAVVGPVAFGHVLTVVAILVSIAVVLAVVMEAVAKRLERLDLLFYFILLILGNELLDANYCGLRLRLGQICGRLRLTCSSSISRRLWTR